MSPYVSMAPKHINELVTRSTGHEFAADVLHRNRQASSLDLDCGDPKRIVLYSQVRAPLQPQRGFARSLAFLDSP